MPDTEVLYQTIINISHEGIWLIDAEARTTFVNRRMAEMLGYTVAEMLGRPMYDFMDEAACAQAHENFERRKTGLHEQHDFRLLRKDGAELWTLMSTSPLHGEVGEFRGALAMVTDITERKRAEFYNSALASLGHKLSSAITREEAAWIVAQSADELFGWDACSLDLYSPGQNRVDPILTIDLIDGVRVGVPSPPKNALPSPMARRVIVEGAQLLLREDAAQADAGLVPFGDTARRSASLMLVPLRNGKKVIGVLTIQSYAANCYNADDLRTLQALADHCGGALERIQSGRALRESEERFRLLVKCIKDYAIFTLDEWGFVTSWNEGAERLLGYSESEIINRHVSSFFTREDVRLGMPEKELLRARAEERADDERWQVRKDGTRFWADGVLTTFRDGHPRGFIKVMRDNTERKRVEEELRENRELFRSAFDYAAIGMALVSLDGCFLQVNRSLCESVGYAERELLATSFQAITHPDDLAADLERVRQMVAGEVRFYQIEKRYIHKLGHVVWILLSVSLVRDRQDQPLYFISQIQDITARKQAEVQLRGSHEQLRALSAHLQSVREEESARIAREIHDELGQSLTGLIIDLSWLENKLSGSDAAVPNALLLKKVRSLVELVDQTIDTVRRIAKELKPGLLDDFGLAAAVEWYAQEFQERTGVHCKFATNMEGMNLPPVYSTALFRIFQEALTNIARHAAATRVEIALEQRDKTIMLEVTDNGRGIVERELSSHRSLGIIGMRERVRLLGGTIQINGVQDRGTTVAVSCPAPVPADNGTSNRDAEE